MPSPSPSIPASSRSGSPASSLRIKVTRAKSHDSLHAHPLLFGGDDNDGDDANVGVNGSGSKAEEATSALIDDRKGVEGGRGTAASQADGSTSASNPYPVSYKPRHRPSTSNASLSSQAPLNTASTSQSPGATLLSRSPLSPSNSGGIPTTSTSITTTLGSTGSLTSSSLEDGDGSSFASHPLSSSGSPSTSVSTSTISQTNSAQANGSSPKRSNSSTSRLQSKLQRQSMQASLQASGLAPDSIGYLIIQKLLNAEDKDIASGSNTGWETILSALKTGKAALLLPKEAGSASDITPKLLRDHTVVYDGLGNLVTLSGLRANRQENTITFYSCVPGLDLKRGQYPESTILGLLSDAPTFSTGGSAIGYPSIEAGSRIELQIPRHVNEVNNTPSPPAKTSAIKPASKSRSLVSLFGGGRSQHISPSALERPSRTSPRNSFDGSQSETLPGSMQTATTSLPVVAFPIEKVIVGKKISKSVWTAIEARAKELLEKEDEKVATMTIQFLKRFHPNSKDLKTSTPANADTSTEDALPASSSSTSSLLQSKIDDITAAMQEFLYDVYLRLEAARGERSALAEALEEDGRKEEEESGEDQDIVASGLEKVERLVCEVLYDKSVPTVSAANCQQ